MFDIILGSFGYVKGGSLNQGHSQGLEGYLRGRLRGAGQLQKAISECCQESWH